MPPSVTDGSKRLAATSDEGTPSKKKQKCSSEERFEEIPKEFNAENEVEQRPPLARHHQQLPQHFQHQHQQQRQHDIHQGNCRPDPRLVDQDSGSPVYPATETPPFSSEPGNNYPASMAGPFTARPNAVIQQPPQPQPQPQLRPHVQQYGAAIPGGMVSETGVPIRREPAPQHGGAIVPLSTVNATGVPIQREHLPRHAAAMPVRIANDPGVPIARSQPGNVTHMGTTNDLGLHIQREQMLIRGQIPTNHLVGNEKQMPHGFMPGPPRHMPHTTGEIPEQRLSINPGHMPQYSDSAIMPSDQGHIPINRMPVNMPMNQGHISRHIAPSHFSVDARGPGTLPEGQRMQFLSNAHLQARMSGYGHPF